MYRAILLVTGDKYIISMPTALCWPDSMYAGCGLSQQCYASYQHARQAHETA